MKDDRPATESRSSSTYATSTPPDVDYDNDLQEPQSQFDRAIGKEVYRAFYVWARKRERLQVRQRQTGTWYYPLYINIREIIQKDEEATELYLSCAAYDIVMRGRNLR